jgi:hypothetical protein
MARVSDVAEIQEEERQHVPALAAVAALTT